MPPLGICEMNILSCTFSQQDEDVFLMTNLWTLPRNTLEYCEAWVRARRFWKSASFRGLTTERTRIQESGSTHSETHESDSRWVRTHMQINHHGGFYFKACYGLTIFRKVARLHFCVGFSIYCTPQKLWIFFMNSMKRYLRRISVRHLAVSFRGWPHF